MDAERERRTLRERQEAVRRALDRLAYASPGTADMLVQVFDNGAIPTTTDKYFACHPVDPGGEECEGCIPTFTPESGTVFVLVVGETAPVAGDYLIAKSVGGRWVAENPGPSECLWTIIVNDLCSGVKLPGSLITISQGGIEIANCTTVGQVVSVTRVLSGANFTSVPTVTISGDGSGATADAVMQLGSLTRTSGGSGYTDGTYTGLGTFTGGGGSGATFTFTVTGGVVQASLPIVTRGTGYTSPPTPDFSAAGAGTGATLTVRLNVLSLTLTAGGSGYLTATVGFSGGGGSGASGTAAVNAQCTLDVPAGDYDIEVTPPADSPYGAYTDTITHTCGQTTTISLDVNEDNVCTSGCGPCLIYPKVIHVTWTYPPGYTGAVLPDDTFTLGSPLPGHIQSWYGTVVFPDPDPRTDPPEDCIQVMHCAGTLPSSFGISSRRLPALTSVTPGIGGSLTGATVTCSPFSVVDGLGTLGSGWDAIG